jgi:hypothetical protein
MIGENRANSVFFLCQINAIAKKQQFSSAKVSGIFRKRRHITFSQRTNKLTENFLFFYGITTAWQGQAILKSPIRWWEEIFVLQMMLPSTTHLVAFPCQSPTRSWMVSILCRNLIVKKSFNGIVGLILIEK